MPVLAASLLLNALGGGLLVREASQHGGVDYLTQKLGLTEPAEADYPVLGRERFGSLPRGSRDVVVMGDSQVQNAPLADLVTDVKQRGIGGQSVVDVHRWVIQTLEPPPRKLVLLVGTNDALEGQSPDEFAADYDAMLDDIERRAPDTDLVLLNVPPASGDMARRVPPLNRALTDVAADHHARVVDLYRLLADAGGALDPSYTDDGVHLNGRGYARAAEAFQDAVR